MKSLMQEECENPMVMVNYTHLQEIDSTRILGVDLGKGLTWANYVDSVCSKVALEIYATPYGASHSSVQWMY